MKKLLLLLMIPGLALADRLGSLRSSADVALTTQTINNTSLPQSNAVFNASSGTVSGQFTAGTYRGGSLSTCGDSTHALSWASGSFACQAITGSGGGGGSSALGVSNNGIVISSPTAAIDFRGEGIALSLGGSATAQVTIVSTTAYTTKNQTWISPQTFSSSITVTSPFGLSVPFGVTVGSMTTSGNDSIGGNLVVGGNGQFFGSAGITNTYGITTGSITLGNIASGTQCLHADGSGRITGTGSDCGSGGGSGGSSTTTVLLNGTQLQSGTTSFNFISGTGVTLAISTPTATQVNITPSFDSSVLSGVYATIAGPNVFTAGGKSTFQSSVSSAGIRLAAAANPSSPVAGDVNYDLTGNLNIYNGVAWATYIGGPTLYSTNTWTGGNTFYSSSTFNGAVRTSTNVYMSSGSTVGFDEYQNGSYLATSTITWQNGNKQKVTLTANTTFLFNAPDNSGNLILRIATGAGSFTASWPGSVLWSGGVAPTITTSASKSDICAFYYSKQAATYYGSCTQNF